MILPNLDNRALTRINREARLRLGFSRGLGEPQPVPKGQERRDCYDMLAQAVCNTVALQEAQKR